MRVWFTIRRLAHHRFGVAALALCLAALVVAPGWTSGAPCAGDVADASAAVGLGAVPPDLKDLKPPRGIDLEVRILNLRVEFPWMRALPISPGHHIVISLLASEAGDRRR